MLVLKVLLSTAVGVSSLKVDDLSTDKKIKILCLHGVACNTQVMKAQTSKLRGMLGDKAVFDYIDGSVPWHPKEYEKDIVEAFGAEGPYYKNTHIKKYYGFFRHGPEELNRKRGFWNQDTIMNYDYELTYLDQAFPHLFEKIERDGPYDVLLGFSQGATMISMATAWFERQGKTPPWKLNVFFCSLHETAYSYREHFQNILKHPCVMVVGKQDAWYEYGLLAATKYQDAIVVEHPDGHRIPRDKIALQKICDEIVRHSHRNTSKL